LALLIQTAILRSMGTIKRLKREFTPVDAHS
jgi:hypothetical protein